MIELSKGTVVVAGGSGAVGKHLVLALKERGYDTVVLSRTAGEGKLVWDGCSIGEWKNALEGAAGVINLAGKSINCKFTESAKKEIIKSRQDASKAIGDAIDMCHKKPKIWINASASGFYVEGGDTVMTEESSAGESFLAATCVEWENAIFDHPSGVAKAALRTGIVLDTESGALKPLLALTKSFLGGAAGSGSQWLPWIHVNDIVNMYIWILDGQLEGVFNGTAPEPETNSDFMEKLRKHMGRPWSPPAPTFMLNLIGKTVGPDSSLLLGSARAVPKRALELGYKFEFSRLEDALVDLIPR
jgi:uncharacterized protein